jgi:hypothetical protein
VKREVGYKLFFRAALGVMIILISLLMNAGCKKDRCFKSAGKITTEERALDDFVKIVLSGDINLFIQQDTVNRVVVEAGANLIPWIFTKTEDEVLTISDGNTCKWMRSYKKEINVYLYCRHPFMIEYRGAGDIKGLNTIVSDSLVLDFWDGSGIITLDVQCKILKVNMHTGPGDAELTGTAQEALYYCRSNGQLRCSGLITGYVYIDAKGTNDSYVYSNYYLGARIGYIGNVYYTGSPQVISAEINERGQLIELP